MAAKTNGNARIVRLTEANLRQSHLYLNGAADIFPKECIGPSSAKEGLGRELLLAVEGFDEPVLTDIPADRTTGKPRDFFRKRAWVRRFFEKHKLHAGDEIAIERLGRFEFSIRPHKPPATRTAAEFFAGIGLVRLALERQGWQVVFANDIDPMKAKMYRDNWPTDDHLRVEDIHKINADDVPTCDLFTASFPCNDLSIAGKWAGLDGKESSAFWGLIRILREMGDRRPRHVLLENVVGFLMSRGGKDLEQALVALNELGYAVDAMILNAKHWTPQSRARLFVVATQFDDMPRRTFALVSDARPAPLVRFVVDHPEIAWDILDLPPLPKRTIGLEDIIEDLPDDDPHWWNAKRADYFMSQFSDRHELVYGTMLEGNRIRYATAFRRVRNGKSMAELRTDGIAGCLRTPRGGSGRQILLKAGKGRYQVRLLTARECARLQGVPDNYVIHAPLNQALFGFGDAVCVPVVEWALLNRLPLVARTVTSFQSGC